MSLWQLVTDRVAKTPQALCVIDENDRSLNFAQYARKCEATAAALSEMGVLANKIVSWSLPTCIEAMVLTGALARLGATERHRAKRSKYVHAYGRGLKWRRSYDHTRCRSCPSTVPTRSE